MKLSARNQIKGTVVSVEKGAVNGVIKIQVAPGLVITSSLTKTERKQKCTLERSTAAAFPAIGCCGARQIGRMSGCLHARAAACQTALRTGKLAVVVTSVCASGRTV